MVERADMRRPSGFAAVALIVMARNAEAQEDVPSNDLGDDVVVRGQQAGGFVSRATIEDSPREITDAASLVEPLPGVHVRRLGADDSFATLSIRGSSSSQVAVYLAGVPLSGGADPTLDLATLPLWPGASARVHRTFAPAALGRGSLGGTLVIDPPSPRSPPRTDVWAAVGSFGSRRMRVGDVRGDPDGVRVASGISASRSDDDFTYLDRLATPQEGHDVFATRRNAGHAAAAGLVSVGMPVGTGATPGALTITGLAQARKQELPGPIFAPTPFLRLDSSRLLSAIELTLPAGKGAFGVRGWGRREGLAIHDDPAAALAERAGVWSTDDVIIAAGASTGWQRRPTDATTIEFRLDGSGERFAPGTWLGGVSPPAARRTNAGAALDATARVFDSATLAASGRVDTWFDSSDDGTNSSETRPTGNVGVEVPIGVVIAATHAGFVSRPASFVERYGNRGTFLGEPNLKPESAFTVDAGGRSTTRVGPLRLHVEAAGFATWAEDLITYVPRGGGDKYFQATNIGRARLLGIEAELRASAFGFEARASETALATRNEGAGACAVGVGACERPPLPGRPAHDFVGDLSYSRGPVRVRYGIDVVAGIHISDDDSLIVPARVLQSAGVRVAVPKMPGLTLALDVRNLFDLRVAPYPGINGPIRGPIGDLFDFPLPGRSFLMSAQWTAAPNAPKPR